jgi:hypothetical protein
VCSRPEAPDEMGEMCTSRKWRCWHKNVKQSRYRPGVTQSVPGS